MIPALLSSFCSDPKKGKAGCYLSEEKVTMCLRWQQGNLNGLP